MEFKSICKVSRTALVELTLEGNSETDSGYITETLTVPFKWEVCTHCEGAGHHSNPAMDGNGITQSEMYELGEEFQENYFSGKYDIPCQECKGNRVVPAIDLELVNELQLELIQQSQAYEAGIAQDELESKAEQMWERRLLGDY